MAQTYTKNEMARELGIDSKTLTRWLARLQIVPDPHPVDRRKQVFSYEQLQQLSEFARASDAPAASALEQLQQQVEALRQEITFLKRMAADQADEILLLKAGLRGLARQEGVSTLAWNRNQQDSDPSGAEAR